MTLLLVLFLLLLQCLAHGDELQALEPTQCPPTAKYHSTFLISEQFSYPDSVGWTRCSFCSLDSNGVVLQRPLGTKGLETILLSWSQWNEFFYRYSNDKFYFNSHRVSSDAKNSYRQRYVVKRPVYIIPMIAIHPGHILIDVLENLYHDMIENYGTVRKDAILIIDVATVLQRDLLQQMLDAYINKTERLEYLASLLHIFTADKVFDISMLQAIVNFAGEIIFEHLHFGISMKISHYYYGYRFHPLGIQSSEQFSSANMTETYRRYASNLANLVKDYINVTSISVPQALSKIEIHPVDVLIVIKSKNRAILNLDEITELLNELSLVWRIVDVGELPFYDQMHLFKNIKVFISVAGTAIHNAQFMNPTTTVIVIMQPYWCKYSWMYTNQLDLLQIHYHTLCTTSKKMISKPSSHVLLGFHRKSWKQGSRTSKLWDIQVNTTELREYLNSLSTLESVPVIQVPNQLTDTKKVSFIKLLVTDVTMKVMTQENFELSVLFDLVGDEIELSTILPSLPYLSLCSDFPFFPDTPTTCVAIDRMNYYASLQFHFDLQIPFAIAHYWLQATPTGGKLISTDIYIPLETRLFTFNQTENTWIKLHSWLVENPIDFKLLIIDYIRPTIGTRVFDNLLRDCCGQNEAGLPKDPVPSSLSPVYQDMISHFEQYTEYLQYFQYVDNTTVKSVRHIHIQFDAKVEGIYELQLKIPLYCKKHDLRPHNCASLVRRVFHNVHQRMVAQQKKLPGVQDTPSPENPFVFLHIEKTGGTTLRDFIVNSSERYQLDYFIPCYKNFTCFNFQLPQHQLGLPFNEATEKSMDLSKVSVIAGHFFWDVWKPLPAYQKPMKNQNPSNFRPSCFVMARHPVQRIISFYDQRFFREVKSPLFQKDLNNFSPEQWEELLIYQRFARLKEDNVTVIIVDEGMSDAACRTMANIKTTAGLENPVEISVPPELTYKETQRALENSKQCVIGILERWDDTIRVINHWFPWISFDNKFDLQLNRGSASNRYIRPDLYEVTVRNNLCDMELYNQMLQQFEEQVKIIETSLFL